MMSRSVTTSSAETIIVAAKAKKRASSQRIPRIGIVSGIGTPGS